MQLGFVVLKLSGLISGAFSKSAFALMRPVTEAAAATVMLHGIVPLTPSLYRWESKESVHRWESKESLITKAFLHICQFINFIARLFLSF